MKTTTKLAIWCIAALIVAGLTACKKDDPELKKHMVEFSPVKPKPTGGLQPPGPVLDDTYYVIARIDGKDIESGTEVEAGKEIVFSVHVGAASKLRFDKWEVTGADAPAGNPETFTVKVKGPLKVTGVFKRSGVTL